MQSYNGDCWLTAVLLALDLRRREALASAVEVIDPTTWKVRIFNLCTRKPMYFTVKQTDCDDPRATRVVDGITWPAAIQNAVVQYNNNTGHLSSVGGYRGLNVGLPSRAFSMIMDVASFMEPMDKIVTDEALRCRITRDAPLVLVTGAAPGFDLVKWHAYTVVGDSQPDGQGVSFLNPWRTGGLDGKGLHHLSAADARAAFLGIYFSWPS